MKYILNCFNKSKQLQLVRSDCQKCGNKKLENDMNETRNKNIVFFTVWESELQQYNKVRTKISTITSRQ